jgi:hypothetical protein
VNSLTVVVPSAYALRALGEQTLAVFKAAWLQTTKIQAAHS